MPKYIRSKSPRERFWPPRYDNGVPVPGLIELTEDIRLCEGLVEMFNELVDLNLSLKWNNNEQGVSAFITENGEINIPKMHPNRKILVKHEISHAAFNSDFDKIRAFLDYMMNYLDPYGRLSPVTATALREDIAFIHNIFEDERVNSCWGLAYPGDGRALDEWATGEIGPELFRKAMKEYKKGDVTNAAMYIVLTLLGQPVKSSKWGKYKKEILDAAADVKLTNFDYCLTRIKSLIVSIIKDILADAQQSKQQGQSKQSQQSQQQGKQQKQNQQQGQQQKPGEPKGRSPFASDDASEAVEKFVSPHTRVNHDKIKSENSGMTYQRTAKSGDPSAEAKDAVNKTMALGDKEIKKLKEEGKSGIKDMVYRKMQSSDKISSPSHNTPVAIGKTMSRLESTFNVHRVTRGDNIDITPEIKSTAAKMRKEFDKVKAKKKRVQEYSGSRLDIGSIIRNRVALLNEPYYDHWKSSKGYEMIIVLDCSSSMLGSKEDIEKLFSTLRLALKGLKQIKLTVFGFAGRSQGETEIFIWDGSPYLFGGEMNIRGSTPMPQALAFVKEVITSNKSKKKSVLFIGDGYPVFRASSGHIDTENLIWWVRQEIEDMTKFGIRTYGLMIGSSLPSDEEMSNMFLSKANWTKLPREGLLKSAFKYIQKEFMRELK
jgi:hypothetical protein